MAQSSNELAHEFKSVRKSLGVGKKEFFIVALLIAAYVYYRFLVPLPDDTTTILIIVLGLVVGAWFAFRPSEWAVEGIESVAGHRGYTAYVAGLLSSLASNMPEAVISGIAAWNGYNHPDSALGAQLLDIAVLSVLIAAGFNMLLLGFTIVIATRGNVELDVPQEVIRKDSVLIRWTIVALTSMFALGIVNLVTALEGNGPVFPREASLMLFLSYIVYAFSLKGGHVGETKGETSTITPHFSMKNAAVLTVIGFTGIFFAGEMLTFSIETLLHTQEAIISSFGDPVYIAALILGAAGALPEHGIALIAAAKGKVGIAIGNLVGGVLQIVLLVAGGIGIFVPIPLDRYVLFQIVVIAGSLWFLKRNLTDDNKLDLFEGMMIILLQAYVFVLLIIGPG